jgi:hypothetical protein
VTALKEGKIRRKRVCKIDVKIREDFKDN